MEINEFVLQFADQFEDTPAKCFSPETKFRELEEWSSLLALSIMAMVNEEYDVSLTASEMINAVTINDLFNTVKSHL